MIGLLLPSYGRIIDLCKTIENTPLTNNMKFIIVANYPDDILKDLARVYHDRAIIIDEKAYGKLGATKAFSLAYHTATELGFSHVISYSDDIIPFEPNWGQRLEDIFFSHDLPMGIFSTDECHFGHFGWNIMGYAPIAHMLILKCGILPSLLSQEYKKYVADLDISVRILRTGHSIALLPIKFNHLRAPTHRNEMLSDYEYDKAIFLSKYPEYQKYFGVDGEQYIPDDGRFRITSSDTIYKTEPWPK